jgi:hypothetical protein
VAMFCTSCVLVQEAASLDPPLWYVLPTFYSYLYGGETLCMPVCQEGIAWERREAAGSSRRTQPASDKI